MSDSPFHPCYRTSTINIPGYNGIPFLVSLLLEVTRQAVPPLHETGVNEINPVARHPSVARHETVVNEATPLVAHHDAIPPVVRHDATPPGARHETVVNVAIPPVARHEATPMARQEATMTVVNDAILSVTEAWRWIEDHLVTHRVVKHAYVAADKPPSVARHETVVKEATPPVAHHASGAPAHSSGAPSPRQV